MGLLGRGPPEERLPEPRGDEDWLDSIGPGLWEHQRGTVFRLEALLERTAGAQSKDAALEEEVVLMVEDIMAEVEVVVVEETDVEWQKVNQRARLALDPAYPGSQWTCWRSFTWSWAPRMLQSTGYLRLLGQSHILAAADEGIGIGLQEGIGGWVEGGARWEAHGVSQEAGDGGQGGSRGQVPADQRPAC